jgi:hypothetical protein
MTTADEIERMAAKCTLNPLTCGDLGPIVPHMTPLCLREWVAGEFYHPFCYQVDSVRL